MSHQDNRPIEIERKFLVKSMDFKEEAVRKIRIAQGYICSRKVTARIRIADTEAFLTIKGKSKDGGLSRFEWERNIPLECAKKLLERCSSVIDKYRYIVRRDGYTWEVDEFLADNEGLVVAEVELNSVSEKPVLPEWILEEVTGQGFYSNSYLAKRPFKTWFRTL